MVRPNGLLDLPADVLRAVVSCLPVRSMVRAGATCRTLGSIVGSMDLHPVMTSRTPLMVGWLARPDVRGRVRTLTARNCLAERCAFLRDLDALDQLRVEFGRVPAHITRVLPVSLRYLDLHRIDCLHDDVFQMSRFRRLTRLHTLKVTFVRNWDMVVLDGLESLPLRVLVVRHAPMLLVRGPLNIPWVHLHATGMVCPHSMTCERLHIECAEGAVETAAVLCPDSCAGLRDLTLSCPRLTLPIVTHMPALERLCVRANSALVPVAQLSLLRSFWSLEVIVRYGLGVAAPIARLPPTVAVCASVGGVPLSAAEVLAMFGGSCRKLEHARQT